jgi:sugar phosphate permease
MDARTLRGWRTRIFFICWLTYAGYYLGRVNLAVALPSIQADLHWSKAAAGLIGSAFYWVYALGQLINGRLGDQLSARRLVAMGLVASALLNLAFGASSALPLMALIWAANGLAQSTGWGPMMKTLARWFEPRQRGRLTALFMPCYVVGHAASWALGGWLCASRGWRYAFIVPGGCCWRWRQPGSSSAATGRTTRPRPGQRRPARAPRCARRWPITMRRCVIPN